MSVRRLIFPVHLQMVLLAATLSCARGFLQAASAIGTVGGRGAAFALNCGGEGFGALRGDLGRNRMIRSNFCRSLCMEAGGPLSPLDGRIGLLASFFRHDPLERLDGKPLPARWTCLLCFSCMLTARLHAEPPKRKIKLGSRAKPARAAGECRTNMVHPFMFFPLGKACRADCVDLFGSIWVLSSFIRLALIFHLAATLLQNPVKSLSFFTCRWFQGDKIGSKRIICREVFRL